MHAPRGTRQSCRIVNHLSRRRSYAHGCLAAARGSQGVNHRSGPSREPPGARRTTTGGGTTEGALKAVRPPRRVRGAVAVGPARMPCARRAGARGTGAAVRVRALRHRRGPGKYLVDELVPVGGAVSRVRQGPAHGGDRRPRLQWRGPRFPGREPAVRRSGCPAQGRSLPATGNRHPASASRARGGEPVHLLLAAAANPAVRNHCEPICPGGVLTAGDRPICPCLAADLTVRDEDVRWWGWLLRRGRRPGRRGGARFPSVRRCSPVRGAALSTPVAGGRLRLFVRSAQ